MGLLCDVYNAVRLIQQFQSQCRNEVGNREENITVCSTLRALFLGWCGLAESNRT